MRIEHTVEVDRPVDTVFAFLSDPANLPQWQSGLLEVTKEPGPEGAGARHREVRSMMGKRIEQTLEVTACEPGKRFDLRVVEGPVHVSIGHTLADVGGKTRITVVGEGDPGPLSLFTGPLIGRALKKQVEGDFRRFKEILEAAGDP